MKISFTLKQFLEIFENHNEDDLPIQILFYLISLIAIYLVQNPKLILIKISIRIQSIKTRLFLEAERMTFVYCTKPYPDNKTDINIVSLGYRK